MIECLMLLNLLGNYCRKMAEKTDHTEENRRSNIEALYGFYASPKQVMLIIRKAEFGRTLIKRFDFGCTYCVCWAAIKITTQAHVFIIRKSITRPSRVYCN